MVSEDITMQSPQEEQKIQEQPPASAGGEVDNSEDHHGQTPDATQEPETTEGTPATDSHQSSLAITVQKRRRVTRACDECRRKKIKCDGKQPCTHCTVYSYGMAPTIYKIYIPVDPVRKIEWLTMF